MQLTNFAVVHALALTERTQPAHRSHLQSLIPVVVEKYERGEVRTNHGTGGVRLLQVDLSLDDLNAAPDKLTDSGLAAGAGFRRP